MRMIAGADIARTLDPDELLAAAEDAFLLYQSGDFQMPTRFHLKQENNTYLVMPCLARDRFLTKLVSIVPDNPARDLPLIGGIAVLIDCRTGRTLLTFDAADLTAWRTGASAAYAASVLSSGRPGSALGLVGAGVQGARIALLAAVALDLEEIYIYTRSPEKIESLQSALHQRYPQVAVHRCKSSAELLEHTQIVVTATNSPQPVLPDDPDLLRGKLFVAVGSYSPTMQELPDSVYKLCDTVYVDTLDAIEESGDLTQPLAKRIIAKEQVQSLGSLIAAKQTPAGSTIIYKSVGMALFDLTLANAIYEKLETS
jgi:ornithine cyclodeaminase/alanine dehydrogenase-like protein (mu-crystallin family)